MTSESETRAFAEAAVRRLYAKKGLDIRLYDVKSVTSVTDYYIVVTGRSTTQVAALADDLYEYAETLGRTALRMEGKKTNNWILVDYADVIVQVFDKPSRDFYNLDRLYADEAVDVSALLTDEVTDEII